jgi:cobyrinic acid a,c-diamide synthase
MPLNFSAVAACSRLEPVPPSPHGFIVTRGTGLGGGTDGVMRGRSMGTWMHQHALASPWWAPALVTAAEGR